MTRPVAPGRDSACGGRLDGLRRRPCSARRGGGLGVVQRRIARIEPVFGSIPCREVDIARAGREKDEAVAVELWQRLAVGLGRFDLVVVALEQAERAELLQFEALDRIADRAV